MKLSHKGTAFITNPQFRMPAAKLEAYRVLLREQLRKTDYAQNEGSIQLPFDTKMHAEVLATAKKKRSRKLKYVVVIGIGGSNLGTKAIFDALHGQHPHMLFLDTVSAHTFNEIVGTLKQLKSEDEFVLVSISKSGGTTETIANTEALLAALKGKFKRVTERLIVVTGKGSKYWSAAGDKGITRLELPALVGGRYSVFTSVGLLPLALAGIDVKQLMKGAAESVKDNTTRSMRKNTSATSAIITYLHNKKGRHIHNSFFFAPELESIGKWYRQLMGESLGKKKNLQGKVVNNGITPIVSIGSTDLHSMAQLYYGGPKDKITNIVTTPRVKSGSVPRKPFFGELVEDVNGKSLDDLMEAIVEGTKKAYTKAKRPFIHIELEKLDAYEIGYYLQFRMIEMMYLAQLMNVNAFNQPAVELYKKETKEILKR